MWEIEIEWAQTGNTLYSDLTHRYKYNVQRTSCTTTVQGHTRSSSEWVTPTVDRW